MKFLTSILFICLLSSCKYTFSDFVEVDKIENVHMHNNMGDFDLTYAQLKKFKQQIGVLPYAPNQSVKLGAIGMTLTIEGKNYYIGARTHGDFIEIDPSMVTKNKWYFSSHYFKTNGLNFDNFNLKD